MTEMCPLSAQRLSDDSLAWFYSILITSSSLSEGRVCYENPDILRLWGIAGKCHLTKGRFNPKLNGVRFFSVEGRPG